VNTVDVMKVLSTIILTGKKKNKISTAMALKTQVDHFELVFLIVLLAKTLEPHMVYQNFLD